MKNLKTLRPGFGNRELNVKDLNNDPITFFNKWLNEAIDAEVTQPNAMTLSTYSKINGVSSRVVLLKELNESNFIFYTNYSSPKSCDISEDNRVSLNFYWEKFFRQVKVTGLAFKVSAAKSEEYFKSRPFESQCAAKASMQSKELDSRESLIKVYESLMKESTIEKPDDWGGYQIQATSIEFWQGRDNRLHDRISCTFLENGEWNILRKYP